MANAPQVSSTTGTAHLTCAKCNGAGRLTWTRQDNGTCYDCKGTGKVRVQNHNALKNKLSSLLWSSWICIEAELDGNTERRDHYLRGMLADMFVIGTAEARKFLTHIRTGAWHDEENGTGYLTETAPPEVANAVADRLIALGKEAVTQKAA